MELLQGTLDVLILRTLAWGPMHGYAVSRSIHERTEGTLDIEDAPLYKALHRLEDRRRNDRATAVTLTHKLQHSWLPRVRISDVHTCPISRIHLTS